MIEVFLFIFRYKIIKDKSSLGKHPQEFFKLKDNASISIEKECDWIVIQDKRYLIK